MSFNPQYSTLRPSLNTFKETTRDAPLSSCPDSAFSSGSTSSSSTSDSYASTLVQTPPPITVGQGIIITQREFNNRVCRSLRGLGAHEAEDLEEEHSYQPRVSMRKASSNERYRARREFKDEKLELPITEKVISIAALKNAAHSQSTTYIPQKPLDSAIDPAQKKRKRDFNIQEPQFQQSNGSQKSRSLKKKKFSLDQNLLSKISISSSINALVSEPASKRKSRTLISAPNSLDTSSLSLTKSSRGFKHPIIDPPILSISSLPQTKEDIAKARLGCLLQRERGYRVQDGLPKGSIGAAQEDILCANGVEPTLRRKIIQWILEVLPPQSIKCEELYEHLSVSKETRFHAMYLFSRYLHRIDASRATMDMESENGCGLREAQMEIIWEAAFCCLVISCKVYHDFLYPLYPIYADEFLSIAPYRMTYKQLEDTQKDILTAFNYQIQGVTPQAFFEELWAALPSLQEILNYGRPLRIIKHEMWGKLQRASLRSDVMRFPVSQLTVAALVEGIILALIDEYEQREESAESSPENSQMSLQERYLMKARHEVKPICRDMAGILDITLMDLGVCREWLSSV
ncbi:hypothetical protein M422DRAFT_783686 [Sphaerobolus stellatus SS14]|uniref:Uncharacterized protein n=1 Tax=Sphaerobolus stellatus (strain SS14) TaxID=990650 RepID=A0A0C9TP80_SPHS4|nr:hypothetical protein M422DRAFT_783686 [Sphaerobolus stellatus SS14]